MTPPTKSEIAACVAIAKSVTVQAIVVGSEALLNNYVSPAQLVAYIDQVRAAVPGIPVTTADTFVTLMNNPDVVAACDFIFVNYYPFWEGVAPSSALSDLNSEDALLRVHLCAQGGHGFGNRLAELRLRCRERYCLPRKTRLTIFSTSSPGSRPTTESPSISKPTMSPGRDRMTAGASGTTR